MGLAFRKMMIAAVLLTGITFSACEEDRYDNLRPPEKTRLDTLYRNAVQELRPRMDSLCAIYQEKTRERLVDSLLTIRLTETEALLKRYGQ